MTLETFARATEIIERKKKIDESLSSIVTMNKCETGRYWVSDGTSKVYLTREIFLKVMDLVLSEIEKEKVNIHKEFENL